MNERLTATSVLRKPAVRVCHSTRTSAGFERLPVETSDFTMTRLQREIRGSRQMAERIKGEWGESTSDGCFVPLASANLYYVLYSEPDRTCHKV